MKIIPLISRNLDQLLADWALCIFQLGINSETVNPLDI
jgi:hypothetical protein